MASTSHYQEALPHFRGTLSGTPIQPTPSPKIYSLTAFRHDFTPTNPNTTTREKFTENILNVPNPPDADSKWSKAVKHQQNLYRALYDHEAMEPNRQQTFMTKANQKSSIYHTWDFVGRTLQFLYMCEYNTSLAQKRGQEKEIFEDALGRTAMSKLMITDETGKFEMMYNSNIDVRVPFSEEIKRRAADYD